MKIAVASMGGTIAMTSDEGDGLRPSLQADQLVAAVPELAQIAELSGAAICNVGSPSVDYENVLDAFSYARDQVAAGYDGVVITHGTDTLEETAFLLDLLWDSDAPLVLTGAMRSPNEPGADGPANLLAAVRVAASEQARGLGVLIVINDEIFAASRVAKTHSFAMDAFASPWGAALGRVLESKVELDWLPAAGRRPALPTPTARPRVSVVATGIGDDGAGFDAVATVVDGLVISGVGAGHVPARALENLESALSKVPVVMASRTGGGRTGSCTYAYPGAEIDLINRGVIMAGRLSVVQARLLLWALLASGASKEQIAAEFAARGQSGVTAS